MHIVWSIAFCVLLCTPLHATTLTETKAATLVDLHFPDSITWTRIQLLVGVDPDKLHTLIDPIKAVHLLDVRQNAFQYFSWQDGASSLPTAIQTLQFKASLRKIRKMSLDKPVFTPGRPQESSVYKVAAPPTIFALVAALALPILQRGTRISRKRWRYQRFSK